MTTNFCYTCNKHVLHGSSFTLETVISIAEVVRPIPRKKTENKNNFFLLIAFMTQKKTM